MGARMSDAVIDYHTGYLNCLECLSSFIEVSKASKDDIVKYIKLQKKQEKKIIKTQKKLRGSE